MHGSMLLLGQEWVQNLPTHAWAISWRGHATCIVRRYSPLRSIGLIIEYVASELPSSDNIFRGTVSQSSLKSCIDIVTTNNGLKKNSPLIIDVQLNS
mmetsp:Transcript_8764/g.20979  ORF Transcript_8764/g.20979 Transcript_8764/m.20979 type:complete len:97 (+) Transcript_8764:1812-2102(+)